MAKGKKEKTGKGEKHYLLLTDCIPEFWLLDDYLNECDGEGTDPNITILLMLVKVVSKKFHFFVGKYRFKVEDKFQKFAENYDEFLELMREEGGMP